MITKNFLIDLELKISILKSNCTLNTKKGGGDFPQVIKSNLYILLLKGLATSFSFSLSHI